jgi:hypothetical protein
MMCPIQVQFMLVFLNLPSGMKYEVHGSVHRKTMEYEVQLDVTI